MTARKRSRKRKSATPIAELIVRRGALRRFDKLKQATADLPVRVSWDRRLEERRSAATDVARDRRRKDRRKPPPFTWDVADFLVVAKQGRKS
jgi:hypothetical protein